MQRFTKHLHQKYGTFTLFSTTINKATNFPAQQPMIADANYRFDYDRIFERPIPNLRDLAAWYLNNARMCASTGHFAAIECARDNRIEAARLGWRLP